jgi:predicted enzyme related to lactoylglutathione lyase
MSKMNPVVHFEMAAEERKRMVDFYTNVFGWKTQQLGPEMGNYILVSTSETDEKGFPLKPGMIGGGFYQKTNDPVSNHPSVVISVDDISKSIQKVKDAGGKVLGEPMPIPGVGTFVSFLDTEGNRASMLQPLENM